MRLGLSLGFVGLVVPQAVLAAAVATAPLNTAPAIGMPILALLAVVLGVLTIIRLRRVPRGVKAGVVGLGACLVLGTIAYATAATVTVQGDDCNKAARFTYNSSVFTRLESACTNPVQIVALDPECPGAPGGALTDEESLQACFIGLILNDGDRCKLPGCTT